MARFAGITRLGRTPLSGTRALAEPSRKASLALVATIRKVARKEPER